MQEVWQHCRSVMQVVWQHCRSVSGREPGSGINNRFFKRHGDEVRGVVEWRGRGVGVVSNVYWVYDI